MRLLTAAAVLALTACSTTSVVSTWKKPGLAPFSFQRVVVFAAAKDVATRRTMEDRLVRELGIPAVPSYMLVPQAAGDEEFHARIADGGFDGMVVMRIVSVDREAVWVPGNWAGPYYGFGGWDVYDPGTTQIDTSVRVETNVITLPDEQLVWAATSRTINPPSLAQLVDETLVTVQKELRRQGLIAPKVALSL